MIMSKVLAISKTLPRTAIRDGRMQAGWGSRRVTDLRQLSYASRQIQLRVTDRRAQASASAVGPRGGQDAGWSWYARTKRAASSPLLADPSPSCSAFTCTYNRSTGRSEGGKRNGAAPGGEAQSTLSSRVTSLLNSAVVAESSGKSHIAMASFSSTKAAFAVWKTSSTFALSQR